MANDSPKPAAAQQGKKRKGAPDTNASKSQNDSNKRAKTEQPLKQQKQKQPMNSGQIHAQKRREARDLATQTTSKAFKNGELDVDKFVKSREFEIRALEEGMARSKKSLTQRAFQQVPKDLRRRTASHNVKRVPKRMQPRAKREVGLVVMVA